MNLKIKYWNNFYKKKKAPTKQSAFSEFVVKKIKNEKVNIFDIGCGNGRDTNFFNKNKLNCFGLDTSKEVIIKNKKNYSKFNKKFIKKDFSKFFKKKIKDHFSVYSRFTWHSINYEEEKKLINHLKDQKKLKYIFIETRTIKDELYNKGKKLGLHEFESSPSHYRRFIDPVILKKKLSKNFKIIYFKQGKNLAKFKKANPWILRIIAKTR